MTVQEMPFQERCRLSAMCVCQRGIAFPSYFACLMVKIRFFLKLLGKSIVVGRGYVEFYSFANTKKLQRLCAKWLSPEPIRKDEKNRDERNGRG